MQTALAVGHAVCAGCAVAMAVYVATMVVLAGAFDLRLSARLSSSGWACTSRLAVVLCVPRLGHIQLNRRTRAR
jgi:hypothetical protein